MSPKVHEAITQVSRDYLKNGIFDPPTSNWSSTIVKTRKPNESYRFCMDFRNLNSVTEKDAYPLPYMSGILDKLRCASYISTLNLSVAYHQILLDAESRTHCFYHPWPGLTTIYSYALCLTIASATFYRLLDRIITPDMKPFVFAYLDDIIIATATFVGHHKWLGRVLTKLKEANLTINGEKCEFCRSQVAPE